MGRKKKKDRHDSASPKTTVPATPETETAFDADQILLWAEVLAIALAGVFCAIRPLLSGEPLGPARNMALSCLPVIAWLATALLRASFRAEMPIPPRSVGIPLTIFMLLLLLSPFVAASTYPAVTLAVVWLGHLTLFLLVAVFDRGGNLRRTLLSALAATAALILLYALAQVLFVFDETRLAVLEDPRRLHFISEEQMLEFLTRLYTNEPYGPFVTANILAGFLAVTFPFLLWLAWRNRAGAGRAAFVAFSTLAVLASALVVLSRSKGGAGAFAASCLTLVALEKQDLLRRHARAALVVAVVLAGVGGFAVLGSTWDPLQINNPYSSLGFRLGYWKGAARLVAEHPLAGVGLDNFADPYLRVKDETAGEVQKTHNDFLQIAAELGLPGLAAFVAFWIALLLPVLRGAPPPPAPRETEAALAPRTAAALAGILGAAGVFCTDVAQTRPAFLEPLGALTAVGVAGAWLWLFAQAHRTLAQALSEERGARELRVVLAAGIAGALAHGLVDMDFYVHGFSSVVLLAGGCLLAPSARTEITPMKRHTAIAGGLLLGLALLAGWYVLYQRFIPAEELRDQAKYGDDDKPLPRTRRQMLLSEAVQLNPYDPAGAHALAADLHADCVGMDRFPADGKEVFDRIMTPCERMAEHALACAPESAALAADLARTRLDHAAVLMRNAERNPRDAQAMVDAATTCKLRAETAARLAVRNYPTNAHYRHLLAQTLDALQQSKEAEEEYRRALELSRGQVLERLKLGFEAERQIEKRLAH